MNCNKANKLMMDYMDFNISQEDEFLLKNHLKECNECKESFELYNEILEEFSLDCNTIIEAPEDFEINIMEKIEHIEPRYIKDKVKKNMVTYVFLAMTSLVFSLFLIVYLNKDVLLSNQSSILYKYYSFFENIFSISIETFNISYIWESILSILPYVLEGLKYTSILTIIAIIIAQYILYRRKTLKL
ncbi:anti-sigma factor family protein [[Clostridium] colinum]|uniref:anti-sigma factor family protein n=1 Tax=[Clostridium] colinum TaxID=36835 RepID=UPI00202472DB|nr:zf-HC2 domain-containing protein [[Clostridium] colinum]